MSLSSVTKKEALMVFFKLCLMMALIELTCRGIALTPTRLSFYINNWQTHRFLQATDPETGAGLIKPHVRYKQMNPDGDFVEIHSDAAGYRNEFDLTGEKFVALGDSFVVAPYTESSKTWPSVLGGLLGQRVYAIGAGNTGPHQQIVLFQRLFPDPRAMPDTIFWMIFAGNDIQDEYEYTTLGKRSAPPKQKLTELLAYKAVERSYALRLISALRRMDNAKKKYQAAMPSGKRHLVWGKNMDFFYSDTAIDTRERSYQAGLEEIKNAVAQLARSVASAKKRLIVVYATSKEEAFLDLLSREFGVKAAQVMSFDADLGVFCRENNIEFLNLRESFREKTNLKNRLFFFYDGHYNDEGNRLAASEIYRYLKIENK